MELVFTFPFSSNYDQISSSLGCDVKKDPLSPQKIGSILVLHMHIVLGIICLGIQFYAQEKKEINNLQQNRSRGVDPGAAGAGVPWNPQILADQLTLSQPRGADIMPTTLILAPPDFQTFLRQ